jgi:predicted nucleic acid-binding protein
LELRPHLGPGESEALVLAGELRSLLLADEKHVLQEAKRRGLKYTSTLIVLELAKERGLIESVRTELADLMTAGFRISPNLIEYLLRTTGEQ